MIAYRCTFNWSGGRLRLHVSADERYELWLDGTRISRGPERGDKWRWYFDTVDITLPAGPHILVARTWHLGKSLAPWAQVSVQPGWLCAPDDPALAPLLGTGAAAWTWKQLDGYTFINPKEQPGATLGAGALERVDGAAFPWGWELGKGEGWKPVVASAPVASGFYLYVYNNVPWMQPAMLGSHSAARWERAHLACLDDNPADDKYVKDRQCGAEMESWRAWIEGRGTLSVPPHVTRRALLYLGDYICVYPSIVVSGGCGSCIKWRWAEALCQTPGNPGDKAPRNEYTGYHMRGMGDEHHPDGGARREFAPLWWRCGLWLEINITTGGEPLLLESLSFESTCHPLPRDGVCETSDHQLNSVLSICERTQQMCAHETYLDCPYYEQLMYAGDTRIQALLGYVTTRDDALQRKALLSFAHSRHNGANLPTSNNPAASGQIIPTFSLLWISMLRDYARWRDNPEFVTSLLPAIRGVLEQWFTFLDERGLAVSPPGWNFIEAVYNDGVFPGCETGSVNASLNWLLAHALSDSAELEYQFGDADVAARHARIGRRLLGAIDPVFWDETRQAYADDAAHTFFSEHAQSLALLHPLLSVRRREQLAATLFDGGNDFIRTSAYFSHYLFLAALNAGRSDIMFQRLAAWRALIDQGFRTTPEYLGRTRSDCHAWSAHPRYHLASGLLGPEPGDWGFASYRLRPSIMPFANLRVRMPHPKGIIEVNADCDSRQLHLRGKAPAGVPGKLILRSRILEIQAGGEPFIFKLEQSELNHVYE
ncbi:family 78 glycoside hydrolase catalytic domain [Termitidicoccus mucosus]|uniref:Alpha-L-rhamnosidase six-hairpin glycosidase domain-containing protein n=1 Tax=Termitidicoccus mucosus TaxID=1184151 RepID=A0A178IPG5_9BACT|nr:hypothetical protein AW736_04970 [Opitutaceae bacterium TSB47]